MLLGTYFWLSGERRGIC